jgi:hypothetical protein
MKALFRCESRFVVLAAALALAVTRTASADSITLSNVQVDLDSNAATASVSSELTASSDTASDVFLDGLNVSLTDNGMPVDLTAGPIMLDDSPFFANTPLSMADGSTLGPIVLFNLTGLVPGDSYVTSFFLNQGLDALELPAQDLAFVVPEASPTPVPEPPTLWLIGLGAAAVFTVHRRRRSDMTEAGLKPCPTSDVRYD